MHANLVEGAGETIKAAEGGEGGNRAECHGRLGRAKRGEEHSGIRRFHEGFADENGVGAGGTDAGGIGGGVDTAFADGSHMGREKRNETLAQAEVRLERGEVAIVDADDPGPVGECAGKLGRGVNLDERVQAGGGGGDGQRRDLLVGQSTDDNEDRAGAGGAGLKYLHGVDEEILTDAGTGGRC